jgi:hypothetical protein
MQRHLLPLEERDDVGASNLELVIQVVAGTLEAGAVADAHAFM